MRTSAFYRVRKMPKESATGKFSKRGDVRAQEFINIPVGEYAHAGYGWYRGIGRRVRLSLTLLGNGQLGIYHIYNTKKQLSNSKLSFTTDCLQGNNNKFFESEENCLVMYNLHSMHKCYVHTEILFLQSSEETLLLSRFGDFRLLLYVHLSQSLVESV